jgi:putative restriction endonuclease
VSDRFFGELPSYPEGSTFLSREELSLAGVHKPIQAGISGSQYEGADSIVLSGGYEDDEDHGEVIVYTGHGGRDTTTGRQISDQVLARGNLALAVSRKLGFPVRVVRGSSHSSPYAPPSGYRYDGLYRVDDHWKERGRAGFLVWRFRLVKLHAELEVAPREPETAGPARRTSSTVSRVIRDTQGTRRIKALYDFRCQICGTRLVGNAGPYAEAAHIKPLGAPHSGPDLLANMLCLCPNHHVLFDYGGIAIADDFSILGEQGVLTVHPEHRIGLEYLRYHRNHYG